MSFPFYPILLGLALVVVVWTIVRVVRGLRGGGWSDTGSGSTWDSGGMGSDFDSTVDDDVHRREADPFDGGSSFDGGSDGGADFGSDGGGDSGGGGD